MGVLPPPEVTAEVVEERALDLAAQPPDEVYAALGSSPNGLAAAEAQTRLAQYGPNLIEEAKKRPLIYSLLGNLVNIMALLLWAAAALAFIAGLPQLAWAILAVILINAAFSFWQEFKAEKAVEALRKLLPSFARVVRDGQESRIPAEELVPGDVLVLAEGDSISADARVVQEFELRTNNSTLTGESVPVRRTAEPSLQEGLAYTDEPNFVFAGTAAATGTGRAVVFATGARSAFGRIAQLTQSVAAEESPLQVEVGRATRVITFAAVTIGVVFFLAATAFTTTPLLEGFIFAIGIVVAFVPEGMLPLVTLSLAVGVQRMARRNALIKKLSAVETLGSTTVICTDKTGTLTQNEMTVREVWLPSGEVHVVGTGYEPQGEFRRDGESIDPGTDPGLNLLLTAGALCCNARLVPPDEKQPRWTVLGDPTEAALIVTAEKHGLRLQELSNSQPRLREIPFESGRKRMSTINQVGRAQWAYVKGAPSEVLKAADRIQVNGKPEPLTDEWRQRIMGQNDAYARNALRVLAMAYRPIEQEPAEYTPETVERELVFLGLEAMFDPPRPEVGEAVERAHEAGIRIVMITGDYGLTAEAIARRVGIVREREVRVITGGDLAQLSDDDLRQALSGGEVIFARVAPEDKLRVVSALKDLGQIVAVTGDGVNDAPALKRADIGIAMGITGTDVAKEAAVMILTDDNFASIVNAVEEGRGVYADVRKFITYIFTSNVAEAVPFILFVLSAGRIPLALTVLQVLAVDLGTDMLPALGLGLEAPEPGAMQRPPRNQKEHLIDRSLLLRAWLWLGLLEAAFGMVAFFGFYWVNGFCCRIAPLPGPESGLLYVAATTITLAAVVFAQVGNVYAVRTERDPVFSIGLFSNRNVNLGVIAELVIIVALVYAPALQRVFSTTGLPARFWLFLLPIPFLYLGLEELRKLVVRRT
ncbi:MAG TPA: cation-transporting P-type ATPase [Anaerolineae bacterium]|nr:cation-transporting P-type ATPase [Anaerolineae bacterium]HOR00883.1 cation-transporting P-type ATPase [Anaerolineae bacterium]